MKQLRVNVTAAEFRKIFVPPALQDELSEGDLRAVRNMSMLQVNDDLLRSLRETLGQELVDRRILERLRSSGLDRIQLNVVSVDRVQDEQRVEEIGE